VGTQIGVSKENLGSQDLLGQTPAQSLKAMSALETGNGRK
jgi:hypothetical protein